MLDLAVQAFDPYYLAQSLLACCPRKAITSGQEALWSWGRSWKNLKGAFVVHVCVCTACPFCHMDSLPHLWSGVAPLKFCWASLFLRVTQKRKISGMNDSPCHCSWSWTIALEMGDRHPDFSRTFGRRVWVNIVIWRPELSSYIVHCALYIGVYKEQPIKRVLTQVKFTMRLCLAYSGALGLWSQLVVILSFCQALNVSLSLT